MIADCVLTGAKAYIRQNIVECSIAIEEGKILKIGKEINMPKADQKINLHNNLVLPGIIDPHVHLRDEKRAYKETFTTGTAAAAAGGVTTVLDMPNNIPVTMSTTSLQNRMQIASKNILVNVGFYSEAPLDLTQIESIVKAGAIGFKLYLAEQIGGLNIDKDDAIKKAFKETAKLNVPIAVHAEDRQTLNKIIERAKADKQDKLTAFLKAHNENVESVAVNRLLRISRQIEKMRLHFCHLSTAASLNAVANTKQTEQTVTCEVTPHNLLLTKTDYEEVGSRALTIPPLRTKEDVDALWKGVTENVVDCIGSDHAPHTKEEKESNNIWEVKPGIPNLETTLPLMLTLVHKRQISLTRVVQLLSEKPASIFSLNDRGYLEQGKNADLTVVDFNEKFKIDASKFLSKAKYSPFNGWEVQGKPKITVVNGQIVMEEQEIMDRAGKVITRGEQM